MFQNKGQRYVVKGVKESYWNQKSLLRKLSLNLSTKKFTDKF